MIEQNQAILLHELPRTSARTNFWKVFLIFARFSFFSEVADNIETYCNMAAMQWLSVGWYAGALVQLSQRILSTYSTLSGR